MQLVSTGDRLGRTFGCIEIAMVMILRAVDGMLIKVWLNIEIGTKEKLISKIYLFSSRITIQDMHTPILNLCKNSASRGQMHLRYAVNSYVTTDY